MGDLVAPRWVVVLAWAIAAIIIVLNLKLIFDVATGA
jgi:manganese transport protein